MLTACNVQLSDLLTSSCCHTALSLIVEHRDVIWTIKNPAPAIHKSFSAEDVFRKWFIPCRAGGWERLCVCLW